MSLNDEKWAADSVSTLFNLVNSVGGGGELPPIDIKSKRPDDGDMEARVKRLEEAATDTRDRLTKIEIRLDTLAAKSDISALESTMHKELHSLTWKLIGVAGVLVAAVYFVATHAK